MKSEIKTADQKAEQDFCKAEAAAERSGLHDLYKWPFICGVLRQKLSESYEQTQTTH